MWDERVPLHVASDFYDLAAFRAGRDALRGFEVDEVGDVNGKSLLHLQCHLGTDTLSWAARGARVTGLDFSPQAVCAARELTKSLGWDESTARFVEADVYDAVPAVDGQRHDIVYTGLGALCWLPDVPRWAHTVARLLKPGGFLYLAEFHPVGTSLSERDPSRFAIDYFHREALVYEDEGTYAAKGAETHGNRSVEWQHPVSEVVTSLIEAGLRLEFLREWDFTLFEHTAGMVKCRDTSGRSGSGATAFRLPPGAPRVPLMYSLRASA
ncbi:class I SAM-dependent methyltransferase [Streptomyces sp. PTM05]|uniref:Class I SAM-dependent methyltransferase n=1 Tax=Streptantibioticus parmotrematis TaxID=2873249 RepID=A0ABS7R0E1_9ACTN|nr:class I SAM-dependent methyltransferase [Streptantibioticus parmotrematis]MBY8888633.1 class I SAM-dependent methyltransferase [Streptantibioticus parmotrematis]